MAGLRQGSRARSRWPGGIASKRSVGTRVLVAVCLSTTALAIGVPTGAGAAAGGWTTTGSIPTARIFHTATVLPDGKVLVAGGVVGNGPNNTNSVLLYDPASGAWSPTGSMLVARNSHTATLLPNGTVLVAGGRAADQGASAELYDPALGIWRPPRQ